MASVEWIAGFFDGEGSISVMSKKRPKNTGPWFSLRVTITNTHRGALDAVREAYGGGVYTHPPRENRRQVYEWYASAKAAEQFLAAVVPHLIVKRPQADLALEFRGLGQRKPYEKVSVEHYDRACAIAEAIRGHNGGHPRKGSAKTVPMTYVMQEV